jgi:site-specific DNA recombinase
MSDQVRWVAVYERTSSDDQRERETIKTQTEIIERYLALHPELRIYRRYLDDGITGAMPMADRPGGGLMVRDARDGRFTAILVTRPSRLGRDRIDRLLVYDLFERLGVELIGVAEPIGDSFMYGISSVVDDYYRKQLIQQSAEGMARAAREGRYCGGIVPLGYAVEGKKETARLVPSDALIWGDWTEANLVKQIYRWLAVDGWSCPRIAQELNALGVPTAYQRDGRLVKERRGERKRRTQGIWRPGRIRNLVVNPVYKGELHYGRRSGKVREVIVAEIEGLVSEEIWAAAQETLARNRIIAKNTNRVYLLRSVIKCGLCGLTYSGCWDRGQVRYVCNGKLQAERGSVNGKCANRSFYGRYLEEAVWCDIERFLRDPLDMLDELASELDASTPAAVAEADRLTLEAALGNFAAQKDRILDLYRRDLITQDDLESQLEKIACEQGEVERRLGALNQEATVEPEAISPDLLDQIRARLDAGLDDTTRQEIVSILVHRIVITPQEIDGEKVLKASVEYRFPSVVSFSTGRGSSPRLA